MRSRPHLFLMVDPAVANVVKPTARRRVVCGADERAVGFIFRPGQAPLPPQTSGRAGRVASGKASHCWRAPSFEPSTNPPPPSADLLFPTA
jgi:hypothetical protein